MVRRSLVGGQRQDAVGTRGPCQKSQVADDVVGLATPADEHHRAMAADAPDGVGDAQAHQARHSGAALPLADTIDDGREGTLDGHGRVVSKSGGDGQRSGGAQLAR